MKNLLLALTTTLQSSLPYLRWVGVVDHELLPPDAPQMPIVGLKDNGLVAAAQPAQHDLETLSILVIVYQDLIGHDPGASLMGRAALGDSGKGLLEIHEDLRTVLNDNLLHVPGLHYAHREKLDPSAPLNTPANRLVQMQRAIFTYRRLRR